MKVLFVLPRMVSGGVERVTLNLIEQLMRDGVECKLALRRCHGELLDEASGLVCVEELAPRGLHQFVPALSELVRRWRPTHVVTAFADIAVLTWLAMRVARSGAFLVHAVHNTHTSVIARPGLLGNVRYKFDKLFASFVYRHANAIVAVSHGVGLEVIDLFGVDPERVTVIHNPVVSEENLRAVPRPRHLAEEPFRIAAIGRLAAQKGFDVLVSAMAQVPAPWQLNIWGEGPERLQLERLISNLGLESAITLRGYTHDPIGVLRLADLFVLPSRHEGLPTTLVEALACQCQIVATDCRHGPREILQDGELGELVPVEDVVSLAHAISRAIAMDYVVAPNLMLDRARAFSIRAAGGAWLRLLAAMSQ